MIPAITVLDAYLLGWSVAIIYSSCYMDENKVSEGFNEDVSN